MWRQRVDYPTLKANVQILAKKWNARRVLVEGESRIRRGRAHDGPRGIVFTAETHALSLLKMLPSRLRPSVASAASR